MVDFGRKLAMIAFYIVSVWCGDPDLIQMDLIEALQLYNTSYTGVSVTTGTNSMHQALELSGGSRAVYLPSQQRDRALSLMAGAREFTLLATLRHSRFNAATLLAVTSGGQRLMELQSSGRTGEVRFHYVRRRSDAHYNDIVVESFRERLADGSWHRLALTVSGSRLSLYVDCRLIETRVILPLATNMSSLVGRGKPLLIWIGQRNTKHFIMQGTLQDMKLVRGAGGQQLQCPQHPAACPTCGQHEQLLDTVTNLQGIVQRLAHRLKITEEALKQLQLCDCHRSCQVNNTMYDENSHWDSGCHTCVCKNGKTLCQPKPCPKLNCTHPHYEPGVCCPTCKADCYDYSRVRYSHGERVALGDCTTCMCRDGMLDCQSTVRSTHCPKLDCPPGQHISVDGQCCQFCPGDDFCSEFHVKCHVNATCVNQRKGYLCQCKPGYTGNGTHCQDVDECIIQRGGSPSVCGENANCINKPGGYLCQCPVGYRHAEDYGCVDENECESGDHGCHDNATCHNTDGGYVCICSAGFTGDGFHCKPTCRHACENGGKCVAGDKCVCRHGFAGAACEHDIDECSNDAHRCPLSGGSVCENLPGWYRCNCAPGYRSLVFDDITGHSCTDIDECAEGSDTCHPNAGCVNTLGGFLCMCYNGENCTQDCYLPDGTVQLRGSTWRHSHQPCRECFCADGVATCTALVTCDCQSSDVDLNCCPQCSDTAKQHRGCYHQERTNVFFKPGDRWLYQCQECECLYGEIDCWSIQCPPTNCLFPQRAGNDCCARCEDDPCGVENHTITASTPKPLPCHVVPEDQSNRPQPSDDKPLHNSLQARCEACDCQVPFCDRLIPPLSSRARRNAVSNSVLLLVLLSMLLPYLARRIVTQPNDQLNAKDTAGEHVKSTKSDLNKFSLHSTLVKIEPRLENG